MMEMQFSRRFMLGACAAAAIARLPLQAAAGAARTFAIDTADGRRCAISAWYARRTRGTILFSHGALSAPAKYEPLIRAWVNAGFDVFAPLHVDSTDHPDTANYSGLKSWAARIEDMRALAAHIGDKDYVAAGHSYGGLVALTLGGVAAQQPEGVIGQLHDPHARAVVAFSPPGLIPGLVDIAGFASLKVPAFIQTGDRDIPPGAPAGPDAWKTHLAAFDAAMPEGDRYALVLAGVDHYFGGMICRPELPGPRQSAQLDAAAALSSLFMKAYGRGDRRAKASLDARLTSGGPVMLVRK